MRSYRNVDPLVYPSSHPEEGTDVQKPQDLNQKPWKDFKSPATNIPFSRTLRITQQLQWIVQIMEIGLQILGIHSKYQGA